MTQYLKTYDFLSQRVTYLSLRCLLRSDLKAYQRIFSIKFYFVQYLMKLEKMIDIRTIILFSETRDHI